MMATTEASEDEEEVVSIGAQSTITSIGSWVGLRLDRGQRRERLVGHGFISTWSHEIPENKSELENTFNEGILFMLITECNISFWPHFVQ